MPIFRIWLKDLPGWKLGLPHLVTWLEARKDGLSEDG